MKPGWKQCLKLLAFDANWIAVTSIGGVAVLALALYAVGGPALFGGGFNHTTLILSDGTRIEADTLEEAKALADRRGGAVGGESSSDQLPPLVILVFLVPQIALLVYAAVRERAKLRGWFRLDLRSIGLAGAGAGALFLTGWAGQLMFDSSSESKIGVLESITTHAAGWSWVVIFILAGALAPVGEEIYFRGRLQDVVTESLGPGWALCLIPAVFGVLHFYQPEGMLVIAMMGVILALLRRWTGGLIAPILAHATFNTVSLLYLRHTLHATVG